MRDPFDAFMALLAAGMIGYVVGLVHGCVSARRGLPDAPE